MLPCDAVFRPEDDEIAASEAALAAAKPAKPAKSKRRTRSERFAVLNAFVDMGMADLTGAESKVWLILFRDTKAEGTARAGQADIGRRAGIDARSVRRALDTLRSKGMVRVVRRGQLNGGPSVYRVHPVGDA